MLRFLVVACLEVATVNDVGVWSIGLPRNAVILVKRCSVVVGLGIRSLLFPTLENLTSRWFWALIFY